MTLLADPATDPDTTSGRSPLWSALAWGAGSALVSVMIVVGAVGLTWSADPQSGGTIGAALASGAAIWLGLGGARLTLDGQPLGILPLVLALWPLLTAVLSLDRTLRHRDGDEDGWVADLLARSVLHLIGCWFVGYAVVAGTVAVWASSSSIPPMAGTLVGPLLVLPLMATAIVLARAARHDEWLFGPRLDGSALPTWLRKSAVPALKGMALSIGIGALFVVAAIAMNWDRVGNVHQALGVTGFGAVMIWVVQAAAVPNFALWVLSFLAGPGFSSVEGATTTWSGSTGGLMPLVPVLAALPQPQAFPWFIGGLALVPVVCGGLIARWSLRTTARLSAFRTKAAIAISATTLTALGLALLDLVGGSALGSYRLSGMGAPAGWMMLALAAEFALGAFVVVLVAAWRLRR